ncbi:DUF6230 family protein [Heyndrickxia sporothermodurans]|uniref:Uncharacterized protein n=1 Tax=Heyndrickxia sporothermodurans TaxID=46224 RepID=A0A150LFD4_9BACI|nr:DUF6230 family protein [Heyndrickxia sporothermodurans]KYD10656.1 hypothetical protein B4102_2295 [Heyndrickxia sporothermodurans]MBL5767263.1 hypothetical protein [Heyndrickxia sporothermodurans]MBL5770798.1 hypothetical protein [Heyndrickxia sporothermodurans]MBL5774429.1 hypothetical protein [Heyndrickxia sporothermodurans]MBL5777976.1 hypothetical protein [Heyndrickxia sporothermodurans]
MNEAMVLQGKTSKKHFLIALLAGFLFLGSLLTVFGATGVAYAMPMGGIGKFNVSFDEMQGKGFKLYGSLYGDPSKGADHVKPVFVNDIKEVTIKGLKISKEVSLPLLGDYTVMITAGNGSVPVELTGLIQKAALVQGNAQFTNMNISENYVQANDPEAASKAFTQGATTVTIKNGSLDTHYLFQQVAKLPGLKVEFIKKGK